MQCAGNSEDDTREAAAGGTIVMSGADKRGTGDMDVDTAGGTASSSADPEREVVTLLRASSRSASRDSVLHTTVTMTPVPTPPPLLN